jgi:sugar O-acyltransferase (sialic acid O-acetyltransferase NeuD family)
VSHQIVGGPMMIRKLQLIIFGNAEIASLAKYYFNNDSTYEVVAFTIDDDYVAEEKFEGLPLVPFSELAKKFPPSSCYMHVALSYRQLNKLREEKYLQAKSAGYTLASYICSKATVWTDLSHGDNCFILENQTIQPGVLIGDNVMLWSGNHIGHGTVINDHSYLASHVVLSGHSKIGKRCFLGVNSTVRDFTGVGDDCFVAMGAGVVRDMKPGSVCLGPKSTIYEADDRRSKIIIKRTFF